MKFILKFTLILALLATVSCGDSNTKVSSQGAPYELFVVCTQARWSGPLGDTLRNILLAPVPMLNQVEPHFDVSRINPNGYTGLIVRHRNQIIVNTGVKYAEPSMSVAYDVTAYPQVILSLTAPSDSILTSYVWSHRKELLQVLMMAERDRAIKYNNKYYAKQLSKEVSDWAKIDIKIPPGYDIRSIKDSMMWLSYEFPRSSIGLQIYSYPYTGKDDLKLDKIVARRDQFAALIPGPTDGSYMITADIEPDIKYQRINGRAWAVVHGFWDVQGDFMGGPFVSFSTPDVANKRMLCIDGYVYSPKLDKRNFMRQIENLIYTVEIPALSADVQPIEKDAK